MTNQNSQSSKSSSNSSLSGSDLDDSAAKGQAWAYPTTAKGDVQDDYHGTSVADPYRWLEEPDSPATRRWVDAQNELSSDFLDSLPGQAEIRARLETLMNVERFSLPRVEGGRHFFRYNNGKLGQSQLFVGEGPGDPGRLLLDPNEFSEDGTVSLAAIEPSRDGKLLAYSTSDGGSDWSHWYFMDVESGELLEDEITRNKFNSLEWMDGNTGVVYMRFAETAPGAELHERSGTNEVCLHLMGTPEGQDILLVEAGDVNLWHWPQVTESGRAVVITHHNSATDVDELEVLSLVGGGRGRGVQLITGFDAKFQYVGNDGDEFWVITDLEAPNRKLVAVNLFDSDPERWRELVPEREMALEGAHAVGGSLILTYLHDAHSEVRIHGPEGRLIRTQELPGIATVGGFGGNWEDPVTYFYYTDFNTPTEIWSLDVASGASAVLHRPELDIAPGDFVTEQVFFESKDGTPVPMFLVHKKGMKRDGQQPTYLYGYGGFNISLTPSFSEKNQLWLERGGLLAIPNLRGGGEYGDAWHKAGTLLQKQNVFDDFIAAAEWLVAEKYTCPAKLAIAGGSNGGLLVGACMTQRPELFAAALPSVGVMDMLRYQHFTVGWAWASDYGTSADPDQFAALYAYSPLHNLRDGQEYPATLVLTGDHDDRVVPAHSYKFAARLQEASAGIIPALIRIETRAGHGGGSSIPMRIEQAADELTFIEYALGLQ